MEPPIPTLEPVPEESLDWETTRNLFFEGDNLPVLRHLCATHAGRVKLIYIDPPYNTGKEFAYSDRFGARRNGGAPSNVEGATRHASWLAMLRPRLELARELLREDGALFLSIDDREVHRLRVLLDELFGAENFVATVVWEKKYAPQNDARWLSTNHEYVVIYARDKARWRPRLLPRTPEADSRYVNLDNDPRGPWKSSDLSVRTYAAACDYPIRTPNGRSVRPPTGTCWRVTPERLAELMADGRVWFGLDGNGMPALKRFLTEVRPGLTSLTLWRREEVGDTQIARRTLRELFGETRVFDTPKPVGLIRKILLIGTEPQGEEIVLDFFAGSGTTAQAVLELNREDGGDRRFILVQLPEPLRHPVYGTIAEVAKERIRRAATRLGPATGDEDLGFRVYRVGESGG